MDQLTGKNFSNVRYEIQEGRLTMLGTRSYLIVNFIYSIIVMGISLAVANANTIGWATLSNNWHVIYYIEAVLLILQILLILFCWAQTPFNQKILSLSRVIYTYKVALDPFIMIMMFAKDSGIYDSFAPLLLFIIAIGLLIHILVFMKLIKDLKKDHHNRKVKRLKSKMLILVIFVLVIITTIIFRSGLLKDLELLFMLFAFTIVYIGMLIGVCEFIIAAYCIFRYPSFSVNSPPKQQYVNKMKKRKRKK
ncbi:hypothetical protein B5V88_16375 [Heyndrickxia sporothermodurans]|uniref:Beta-carotene 15,15'-monooxygenase n=1 Tax=Heyndrickxia sporothermodurans TaxID=46224 RepID=A0AB37HKY9_9BACI|nr:hypothetical protein [Heyndrickxia sporothermodurans]MBL5773051.1 hypothetical protein [Heyndrickxia sporothermodurans]MBL5780028.1 hypothetical protein [Heyndrickxia sporothermodurans]MBL5782948.1 hypothetical protein [Heyndrickxia sporothermodurans]MBL5790717.1 hypothetical protein [Heyndrickxia sporothermodurans]MBL5794251.1 hypothetical protein [Heyndrickxia sporothermodurans]